MIARASLASLVACAVFVLATPACQPGREGGSAVDKPADAAPKDAAKPTTASVPAARPHVQIALATDDSDALTLVRTRRLEAKAEGRVLVVYIGATWCEPCKRFKSELASGRLDERLSKVTLLAFDVDKDGDRLEAAGYRASFVPFVALPGPDGHPAETAQATGKGSDAWRELLGKLETWQPS